MPIKVKIALEVLKNWRAVIAIALGLVMVPMIIITTVINMLTNFLPDPDISPSYKSIAQVENVNWKEAYVIDFIRYDGDIEKGKPSKTVELFIYYTEHEETRKRTKLDKEGKPVLNGDGIEVKEEYTETVREKHIRSMNEVMGMLNFSKEQIEDAREQLDGLIDDEDIYGGDHSGAIPSSYRSLFQALQTKYGIEWYVLGGIWYSQNQTIYLPQTIWDTYKIDGNSNNLVAADEQDDQIYSLANYLNSVNYKADLNGALEKLLPGQVQSILQQIEILKAYDNAANSNLAVWPTPDYHTITSPFIHRINPVTGKEEDHKGVDFGAPSGSVIIAAFPGVVVSTTPTESSGGYGNLTIIENTVTHISYYYAHQSRFAVAPGMLVQSGDLIGYVGSTGQATGPHLHFEIRINGTPVDPLPFLKLAS